MCTNTSNKERQQIAARRFGVSFTVSEQQDNLGLPPAMLVQGDKEAIANYSLDEFENGNLIFEISGRPEPGG